MNPNNKTGKSSCAKTGEDHNNLSKSSTSIPEEQGNQNINYPAVANNFSVADEISNSSSMTEKGARSTYSGFIESSPEYPCPVCNNTEKNKCRQDLSTGIVECRTHVEARKGFKANGYVCVKETQGFTATFKLDNKGNNKNPKLKSDAKKVKKDRKQERKIRELAVEVKDKLYRNILQRLTLTNDHREQLKARGFDDEFIDKFDFKSIQYGQKLLDDAPTNLPGHDNGYAFCKDGIVYPVISATGRYQALFSKPDDPSRGKYKPLSSRNLIGYHVNGEIPIGFNAGNKTEDSNLWLVEGGGLKAPLASHKHLINVLSAVGGYFYTSPDNLTEALAIQGKDKQIILAPDGGDCKHNQQMKKWIKNYELIKKLGYDVKFAWWGQYEKKVNPDIDELKSLNEVQLISMEEFREICKVEIEKEEERTREEKKRIWKSEHKKAWEQALSFAADEIINSKEFKYPDNLDFRNKIIAIKSCLGTGKTRATLDLISKGILPGCLQIGSRNNLLFQIVETALNEFDVAIYHIHEEESKMMLGDENAHHALCVDSLEKVDGYFKGKTIILDELCSTIRHILEAGTLGNKQAKAIKILNKAIQEAETVILIDANLSDIYVDFISKIAPGKDVLKIENKHKPDPRNITFFDVIDEEGGLKRLDKSPVIKRLFSENEKPFIVTDSKRLAHTLDLMLKENGKKGIVLSSDTSGEEWAKDFFKNPNEYISDNGLDYVIITPTAEAGVSVTIPNWFTAVYAFFYGVLDTKTQTQILFRYRPNVPYFIFCPEFSVAKNRNNPASYLANTVTQEMTERINLSVTKAGINFEDLYKKAISRELKLWSNFDMELVALDNFEQDSLRACLISMLESFGHNVKVQLEFTDDEINEYTRNQSEIVLNGIAQELAEAEPFEDIKAAEKAKKVNPGRAVKRRIEVTHICQKVPGIRESEIWDKDFILNCIIKDDFIGNQLTYWMLQNPEVSLKRHQKDWFFTLTSEFFHKSRKKKHHDKVWALQELEIMSITKELEYNKDSEVVNNIISTLRKRKDIQLALNYKPKKATAEGKEKMNIISTLLRMIGLKNHFLSQKIANGVKTRFYRAAPTNIKGEDKYDLLKPRKIVLELLTKKWEEWNKSKESNINWEEYDENLLFTEWENIGYSDKDSIEESYINGVAEMLTSCDDEEMLNDVKSMNPMFAIKAAITLLTHEQKEKLIEWGLPNLPYGAYKRWLISESYFDFEYKIYNKENQPIVA